MLWCGVKVSVCVSVMWNVCDVELSINLTTIREDGMSPNLFLINSIPGKDAQMLQCFDSFLSLILLSIRVVSKLLKMIFFLNFRARVQIGNCLLFNKLYVTEWREVCSSVRSCFFNWFAFISDQVASVLLDISNVCTPNIRWASGASQLQILRWWTLEYQISWISIIVQSDQRYHHPTITADIWCSAWNKLQPASQPVKILRLISRW